jgi:hypothetical protein
LQLWAESQQTNSEWDRTLKVKTSPGLGVQVTAGGLDGHFAFNFATEIATIIMQSASIHYLSLDADRAYPKIQIPVHELGQAFERDWDTTNKQSSFRITRNLYEEWFRFLLGKENQENNRHIQQIRIARSAGVPEPAFIDQFEAYESAVKTVLPHLLLLA